MYIKPPPSSPLDLWLGSYFICVVISRYNYRHIVAVLPSIGVLSNKNKKHKLLPQHWSLCRSVNETRRLPNACDITAPPFKPFAPKGMLTDQRRQGHIAHVKTIQKKHPTVALRVNLPLSKKKKQELCISMSLQCSTMMCLGICIQRLCSLRCYAMRAQDTQDKTVL